MQNKLILGAKASKAPFDIIVNQYDDDLVELLENGYQVKSYYSSGGLVILGEKLIDKSFSTHAGFFVWAYLLVYKLVMVNIFKKNLEVELVDYAFLDDRGFKARNLHRLISVTIKTVSVSLLIAIFLSWRP